MENKIFAKQYMKPKKNWWKLISIVLLIVIWVFFTLVLLNNKYNQGRQEGYNQGVEYWNNYVINIVNNQGVIPYYYNGSIQGLPINQLCKEIN